MIKPLHLVPALCLALGAAGAVAVTGAIEARSSDALQGEVYSLIHLVPGSDPESGERYDEFVTDFDLSADDCLAALQAAAPGEWSCERQPLGPIAGAAAE